MDGRKRRGGGAGNVSRRYGGSSTRAVRELYTHAHECVTLLAELLTAHHLTDTTVLHASTVGVSPFFVENVSELQLSALKLVTTVRIISCMLQLSVIQRHCYSTYKLFLCIYHRSLSCTYVLQILTL